MALYSKGVLMAPSALESEWHAANAVHGEWNVQMFERVCSTMDVAASPDGGESCSEAFRAPSTGAHGAPETISVFCAREQTQGRGRMGRSWVSAPGRGLYATYVFRADGAPLAGLSLVCGAAVCRFAIKLGISAKLKWPNDVVIDGERNTPRKLAGVLVDVRSSGQEQNVLAGIGINLREQPEEPRAVSLEQLGARAAEISRSFERALVMFSLELEGSIRQFLRQGFPSFLDELNHLAYLNGRTVSIESDTGRIEGIATAFGPDGALIVSGASGARAVYSGTIVRVE